MTSMSKGFASPSGDSKLVAHNLIMQFTVSMALKAVVRLGIPDILDNVEGKRPLSVDEILAQLPTKSSPGPKSSTNLKRILGPLAREGVFSESTNAKGQPVYGLTEVSKCFIRSSKENMVPIADMMLHTVLWENAWQYMHEVILDETSVPFISGNGLGVSEYCNHKDPEFGAVFQSGMSSYSHIQGSSIVDGFQQCGVLDAVNTLVDVGGCQGAAVAEIVAHIPHIQGINFDLPDVVKTAPAIRGVQHIGGSFFEEVPAGDAVFMKFIIHNYGDEDAIKILQNCFKALPKNGKVIIAEYVQNTKDSTTRAFFIDSMDLTMLTCLKGARERNEEEYWGLLLAAGFSKSHIIWNPNALDLVVGLKEE